MSTGKKVSRGSMDNGGWIRCFIGQLLRLFLVSKPMYIYPFWLFKMIPVALAREKSIQGFNGKWGLDQIFFLDATYLNIYVYDMI